MGLYISLLIFVVTLLVGVPVGVSIGLMGVVGVLTLPHGVNFGVIAQRIFTGLDSFPLLCIPFFIMAGDIMNSGKITDRLVRFSDLIMGRFRGALAYANVIASMFFGGITGSAAADVSALGTILIPAMEKDGYDPDFSAAVTASSSLQGPIIPPSVLAVVYGASMGESIGALFAAGIPLGIMFGITDMAIVWFLARKRNYPKHTVEGTTREKLGIVVQSLVAMMMPIIILGGILTGIFTPTEAAAVAVAYSLVAAVFVLKTLKIRDIPKLMVTAAVTTGAVFLLLATARLFSWVLSTYQVPMLVKNGILSITDSPVLVILLLNLLLLAVGCIMDPGAAIIMLAPTLAPLAIEMGMHPVQFGMLMIINLALGLVTPPVGLCLFLSADLAKISVERVTKAVLPFFVIHLIVLLIVSFIPEVSLFVPRLAGFL